MARTYRKFTEIEVARAKRLRGMGYSFAAIGKALGRAANSVEHRLARESGKTHSKGRKCDECAEPISNVNKTGRCRACALKHMNRDPAFQANRIAALNSCEALKVGSATRREAARKATVTRMSNPAYVEWLRHQMATVVAPLGHTPEAEAKRNHKEIGRKRTETLLGWCPPECRDDYRHLVMNKGIKAADAKQIILDQIRTERERVQTAKRRELESLSPFERQERALRNGAQLVANDQKPSLANPGIYEERKAG